MDGAVTINVDHIQWLVGLVGAVVVIWLNLSRIKKARLETLDSFEGKISFSVEERVTMRLRMDHLEESLKHERDRKELIFAKLNEMTEVIGTINTCLARIDERLKKA